MHKKEKTKQVIIGNSAAALSAIRAIRGVDCSCSITLISAENCNAYSPVLLSYYISGKISRDDLFIVGDSFYKENNVEVILGKKAIDLDIFKRRIYLEDKSWVEYDNLLIVTGSSPKHLTAGVDLPNVLTLKTIEDAERILGFAKDAREILLVGAGPINLQVANALFNKRSKFTFVVGSQRILSQNTDSDCAAIIQKEMESRGTSIFFGRDVKEIKRWEGKTIVILDSGQELKTDMVIVGKGVSSNTQMVKNSGIKINKGILVDEFMRTNIENIFAAGDVAEGRSFLTGENEVLATWFNACDQGRIAGWNMAGYQKRSPGGLFRYVTTLFGLTIVSMGLFYRSPDNNEFEKLLFSAPERKIYRKILLKENKIVGAILLGEMKDAGLIKNLIENKIDISCWKDGITKNPLNLGKIFLPMAGSSPI